jgi:hypothetical protein
MVSTAPIPDIDDSEQLWHRLENDRPMAIRKGCDLNYHKPPYHRSRRHCGIGKVRTECCPNYHTQQRHQYGNDGR